MTTDLTTTTGAPTALTIAPDQAEFSAQQVAALEQLGVADASPGDLAVFFHVAKRSGLDPFARQIHMVSRRSNRQVDGQWVSEVKQTIQTGIDGYRLIARRAADRAGIAYHVEGPVWYDHDGREHPIWVRSFGEYPAACKVTVVRDGQPFPAIAMFAEYVQTTGRGENLRPNSMWSQRPAGQLAKCAEALALRMAFPQDLSGMYVDAEVDVMEQAPARVVEPGTGRPVEAAPSRLRSRMRVVPSTTEAAPEPPEDDQAPPADDVAPEPADTTDAIVLASDDQIAAIGKGFRALGIRSGKDKVAYVVRVLQVPEGDEVPTPQQMTTEQAAEVITSMEFDQAHPDQGGES